VRRTAEMVLAHRKPAGQLAPQASPEQLRAAYEQERAKVRRYQVAVGIAGAALLIDHFFVRPRGRAPAPPPAKPAKRKGR
jgi:hypothetical protein